MHLGRVIKGPKEALRSFVKRFNLEALPIQDLNAGVACDVFIRGLRSGSFKFNLAKKKITTLAKALGKAEAFIHATEVFCRGEAPKSQRRIIPRRPKLGH